MAEDLHIPPEANLEERYKLLLKQAASLLEDEPDLIANLANITALLKMVLDCLWVGFYRLQDGELILGPFQGTLGCTRIGLDRGVCGNAARDKKIVVVEDVQQFPDHIFCDANSRSEIVLPIFDGAEVALVLDLDSDTLNNYGDVDVQYLEQLCSLIQDKHFAA